MYLHFFGCACTFIQNNDLDLFVAEVFVNFNDRDLIILVAKDLMQFDSLDLVNLHIPTLIDFWTFVGPDKDVTFKSF